MNLLSYQAQMMEGALEETVDEQTEDETDAEELTDQE